jgi:hypothetical protein
MTGRQALIAQEFVEERDRQDTQWGGPAHDDQHTLVDWFHFIRYQAELFHLAVLGRGQSVWDVFARPRLVKIGALAMAAIEAIDRKREREEAEIRRMAAHVSTELIAQQEEASRSQRL